ncbi:MAG: hypothetical protein J6X84_06445 [Treponema sp.]|nr:hypothetical protein [Treponema sp.]
MSIRILKKALGLLVVDIIIIIGIFVLQFRTDSSIIKKIGNLQITLETQENQNGEVSYKNKVRVSYNGINFYCDDQSPATLTKNNREVGIRFVGVEQKNSLSYTLKFQNNVKVTFELASAEPAAALSIITDLPAEATGFSLPYNYASSMSIQKSERDSLVLGGKRNAWEFSAHSVLDGRFDFTPRNYIASYSVYDETQKFSFDSIMGQPLADYNQFVKTVSQFKKNLISSYDSNNVEANITEQVAVSYIAAQTENQNYKRAIEAVPDSIKKSKQRTYLSAPYLNTLEEMNANLEKAIKDYEARISDSAAKGTFDLFTVHKIADFIYLHSSKPTVTKLLENAAAAEVEKLSISQITGILQVYADLSALAPAYAEILTPVLEPGIARITESCKYEGNILTISENDTFLSVNQAVETGIALLRYGRITENQTLIKAGYAIVNSYLAESASFDLRTLSNLYPVVAFENQYYPHLEKIFDEGGKKVWSWTCAKSIKLDRTSEEYKFTIDFPEGDTHYVILKGIPQFSSIYIYDMAFRTDPRFETYNSSGYVYKKTSETLLLKSRHKTQYEKVRLVYKAAAPSGAQPAAATTPARAAATAPAPSAANAAAETPQAASEANAAEAE